MMVPCVQYCSCHCGPGRVLTDLRYWLSKEADARQVTLKIPAENFSLCDMAQFTNVQRGLDCGMWMLRRADLLSRNVQPWVLEQDDMAYWRRRTMLELLKQAHLEDVGERVPQMPAATSPDLGDLS